MTTILEAVAIVGIALVLLWPVRADLRAVFSALPRRYAGVCFGLWFLLIGGQVASSGEMTFPLTDWSMHTASRTDDPEFIDYTVELASGRQDRLLIGQLFPVVGKKLRSRIDQTAYALDRLVPGPEARGATERFEATLATVARQYDAQHPGEHARVIRLWSCTVALRGHAGSVSISRELMREYRVM